MSGDEGGAASVARGARDSGGPSEPAAQTPAAQTPAPSAPTAEQVARSLEPAIPALGDKAASLKRQRDDQVQRQKAPQRTEGVRQGALPNAVGRDGAGGATMSGGEGGAASVAIGAQDSGGPSEPSGDGFHSQAIGGAIGGSLASDSSAGTGRVDGTAVVAQQALLSDAPAQAPTPAAQTVAQVETSVGVAGDLPPGALRRPLTDAEQAMVAAAWNHNDESETVVCSLPAGAGGSSVDILGKHFGRMRNAWLFDESVNAYMFLLQERDNDWAPKHGAKPSHFMSSFFFEKVWP